MRKEIIQKEKGKKSTDKEKMEANMVNQSQQKWAINSMRRKY